MLQALDDTLSASAGLEEAKEIAARLGTQKQGLDQVSEKRLQALTAFLAA